MVLLHSRQVFWSDGNAHLHVVTNVCLEGVQTSELTCSTAMFVWYTLVEVIASLIAALHALKADMQQQDYCLIGAAASPAACS